MHEKCDEIDVNAVNFSRFFGATIAIIVALPKTLL